VMMYEGKIADGVYHSSCGGKTESNQNAWSGTPIPYLQGVACYPELDSIDLSVESDAVQCINTKISTSDMASWEKRSEMWERELTKATLEKNSGVSGLQTLEILKRGVSGRIIKLKLIGNNSVILDNEWKIRQQFGGLPSSFFYITNRKNIGSRTYKLPETINIKGKGSGHGVGLCQVGTLQKARQGWKWDAILLHYYPKVELGTEWLSSHDLNNNSNVSD
jgi:stage II sporulation protein D